MAVLALALVSVALWATDQHSAATRAEEAKSEEARISALRAARLAPWDLETPESASARAAAEIWIRVQEGRATEAEMRELAEASIRLDFNEPSLLDLSRNAAIGGGGHLLRYATRVYACPAKWGFLVNPRFVLDSQPLPETSPVFRSRQRRLALGILVPELTVGQHILSGRMEVALARLAPADTAGGRHDPISPVFTFSLGPYRFAAVDEHPADYPVVISERSYQERIAAELIVEGVRLTPEPQITNSPPAERDELHVLITFPPPPLELALNVRIRALDAEFVTEMQFGIAPSEDARGPELIAEAAPLKSLFDSERCRLTLRVPVFMILATTNPETLLGRPLVIDISSSRDAARSASFERYLSVAVTREVMVEDARPPERRAAAALAYALLDDLLFPSAAETRLREAALDGAARDHALALLHELDGLDILAAQIQQVTDRPGQTKSAYATALARAREFGKLAPDAIAARQLLGVALYRNGLYDAAAEALNQALELAGGDRIPALAFLAMAEYCGGRVENADAVLDRLDEELASTPVLLDEFRRQARGAAELIRSRQPCPPAGVDH